MRITFKLFAMLAEHLPADRPPGNAVDLEVPDGSTVAAVIDRFQLPLLRWRVRLAPRPSCGASAAAACSRSARACATRARAEASPGLPDKASSTSAPSCGSSNCCHQRDSTGSVAMAGVPASVAVRAAALAAVSGAGVRCGRLLQPLSSSATVSATV